MIVRKTSVVLFGVYVGICLQRVSLAFTSPRPLTHRSNDINVQLHSGSDDWLIDEDEDENSFSHHKRAPQETIINNSKQQSADESITDTAKQSNNDQAEDIRSYFATCIPGLQNILASELTSLGATYVETQGLSGVAFTGSPKVGLNCILWCRTAHKIMELIASSADSSLGFGYDDYSHENGYGFSQGLRNADDLYQFAKIAVHTPTLLGDGQGGLSTISVNTIYTSRVPKDLCHGHFTALTVKNALVDSVRELREEGDRPDVDVDDADVPLVCVVRGRRIESFRGRGRDARFRGGRGSGRGGKSEGIYEELELVADVDIYRCLHSGGSLHRRGYRSGNNLDLDWSEGVENDDYGDDSDWEISSNRRHSRDDNNKAPIHRAAMKESLASGLLLEAGWDKLIEAARSDGQGAVLIDPMTGSGTLPTEAALIACDMAPGLLRIASLRGEGRNPHRYPPATRWKDFSDLATWNRMLAEAAQRAKDGMKWAQATSETTQMKNVVILGNELNPRAVGLSRTSVANSGVGAIVSINEGNCNCWKLGGGEGDTSKRAVVNGRTIIVCNPPWGVRLTEDIDESWVSLREFLRREGHGAEAWVLSGNKDLTKILRMKKSRSVVVRTAEEDLRWLQYHIFQKSEVES